MVEFSAYAVAIAAVEVLGTLFVVIGVYENTSSSRTNWGGILVKRSIEVFLG